MAFLGQVFLQLVAWARKDHGLLAGMLSCQLGVTSSHHSIWQLSGPPFIFPASPEDSLLAEGAMWGFAILSL